MPAEGGRNQENIMNPWETSEGKQVWKTKANYFQWLRGNLRKIWADYPVRKVWKREQLRPVMEEERLSKKYHPSTKNVGKCVMCNEWMAGSKLECDHIHSSNGCKSWEEVDSFLRYCVATLPKDWQLVCKPCHKDLTYAERYDISFEEAGITKKVIALEKDKKVMQWFAERDIVPESNAKKRRVQMVEILMGETYGK